MRSKTLKRVLGIVLLAASAIAANSPNPVQQARDLYYRGIYGDRSAGEKADNLFTSLHSQSPADPLVTVYFGSLRLLEAQHTWALWRKNSLSKQGIQLMDSAVAKAPDNLEVRFVRAATERSLPSFFGRKEQAESEIQFIAKRAQQAVQQGQLEPRLAAATFFYYGEWCQQQDRVNDAKQAWQEAVKIAPDSNGARKSSAQLSKLP